MALFKILKGKSENLPGTKVNGYCYVTTDEHKFYVDYVKDDDTLDRFALNAAYADSAGAATKLATPRTISLSGSITGSGVFDGSGNLSIATTTNHTHSYLPLSGGTLTGNLQIGNSDSSATSADAVGIVVRDLRNVSMTPNTLGDRTAVFYFDQAGPSEDPQWKGILRVKGWTDSYEAWELAGPADDSDAKEFYVRSGRREAWGNWRKLLTDDNYTNYTVTKTGSGASGTWGINITGNADTVDGYHASSLWRSDGGTWNPSANIALPASGDNQEWSFDIHRNGYTGCYWHVWEDDKGPLLKVDADSGEVQCPYSLKVGNTSLGYTLKVGGSIGADAEIYTSSSFFANNHFYQYSNNNWYATIVNHGSGNIAINAAGEGLYLGNQHTNVIRLQINGNSFAEFDANSHKIWGSAGGHYPWLGSALEIRESQLVTASQDHFDYAPKIGFHWGNRVAGVLSLEADDVFRFRRSDDAGTLAVVQAGAIYGAVWNDYAECRESDCEEFGYVLAETGDDTLTKTIERLQPFAGVSSDTWGFSQGETEKAKTPIAVAGRVLVYTYQDRNNYKPGDCVCTAPGGTVDIMTREEVREWPDRIVGTVSCVPDYEEWGGGEGADRKPIKVNGRIWIKVV